MADIPELELKMVMDYDPKQIYKDASNNYIRVKFTLKAYQNGEPYEGSNYQNKVYLKGLSFSGELGEVETTLADFESLIKTGEIVEYTPNAVEEAKLALRGFLR